MKNTSPFHIALQVLKVHLIKIREMEQPDLVFLAVLLVFTSSADIIFPKFFELYSSFSVKKAFVTNCLF